MRSFQEKMQLIRPASCQCGPGTGAFCTDSSGTEFKSSRPLSGDDVHGRYPGNDYALISRTWEMRLLMEQYRSIYEPALATQCILSVPWKKLGIEQVRSLLRGKTTVLAGPSGVGKSSLTNRIQPEAEMETGDISRKIERGKHTTRHSAAVFCGKRYLHDGHAGIQFHVYAGYRGK